MWLHVVLLTGSALCALLSVWSFIRAARSQDACAHAEARLLAMRGRVIGAEAGLENLAAQHRKLAGRVYADEYWNKQVPEAQPHLNLQDGPPPESVGCENWRIAQREGPHSAAAKCECASCVIARNSRDEFRRRSVPKTAQGVAALAKLNGSNDG